MSPSILRILAVTALGGLAACSGGGSVTPSPTAKNTVPAGTVPAATASATLTFTRRIPQSALGDSSAARKTREISYAANSFVIDAAQTGAAPYHAVFDISGAVIGNGVNCTTDASSIYQTCVMQVRLPIGNDTLTVTTNSARDGSGTTLGGATIPVTIKDQQDNPIAITLDGIPKSIRVFVSDPSPVVKSATQSLALTVQLYDAAGAILLAPQNFTQPVVVTDGDTSSGTSLFTGQSQNSTQRYNGTAPSPQPTTPPGAKTISVPDRYTVPYVALYNGMASPFTITATFGSLSASVTITPQAAANAAARPAGQTPVTHTLANTVRTYDPIFDATGKLWVTQTGGKIASIDTSNYTVTGTYTVTTATTTRSLRSPVLGPDNAIYISSATVSNGVATAPYYVTRFDPVSHAFTDYASSDQVLHLTLAAGALTGAERNTRQVWRLPFTGTTPGTPAEFSVSAPPVGDPTPALLPLPTRVFPTSDGNLLVIETSYAAVNGTWIAKYSPSGTKLSEAMIVPQQQALQLDAQAMDANGSIWFADLLTQNQFVRVDTPAQPNTLATYAVPRFYGNDAVSELTNYAILDAGGNLWFVSYLDNGIRRIDRASGRVDTFNGATGGGNQYGLAIGPDGTLVQPGYGSGPYLYTNNTK